MLRFVRCSGGDGLDPRCLPLFCDALWFSNGLSDYTLVGGNCGHRVRCGTLYADLIAAPSAYGWHVGACLSFVMVYGGIVVKLIMLSLVVVAGLVFRVVLRVRACSMLLLIAAGLSGLVSPL